MMILNEFGKKIELKHDEDRLIINGSSGVVIEGNNVSVGYFEILGSKDITVKNVITDTIPTIFKSSCLEIKGCHFNGLILKDVEKSVFSLNSILGDLELIRSNDNWIMHNKNECKENIFLESSNNKYFHNIINFDELSLINSNDNKFIGNLPLDLEKIRVFVIEKDSKKNIFKENLVVFEDIYDKKI